MKEEMKLAKEYLSNSQKEKEKYIECFINYCYFIDGIFINSDGSRQDKKKFIGIKNFGSKISSIIKVSGARNRWDSFIIAHECGIDRYEANDSEDITNVYEKLSKRYGFIFKNTDSGNLSTDDFDNIIDFLDNSKI